MNYLSSGFSKFWTFTHGSYFQTQISTKPLGQLWSNNIRTIVGLRGRLHKVFRQMGWKLWSPAHDHDNKNLHWLIIGNPLLKTWLIQTETPNKNARLSVTSQHCSLLKTWPSQNNIWATTCDFQQCCILTSVDSDKPVQPPCKLRNSKGWSVSSLTLIEYLRD